MFVLRQSVPRILRHSKSIALANYQCTQFYGKKVKLNPAQPATKQKSGADKSVVDTDGTKVRESAVADIEEEIRQFDEERKKKEHQQEQKRQATHQTNLMVQGDFEHVSEKTRESFLTMVEMFDDKSKHHRRNHVEFIYAALKNMKDFGVATDLEVYKALLDVMPKGKFIARTMFQAEFMHYPKQQECITMFLEQMEDYGECGFVYSRRRGLFDLQPPPPPPRGFSDLKSVHLSNLT